MAVHARSAREPKPTARREKRFGYHCRYLLNGVTVYDFAIYRPNVDTALAAAQEHSQNDRIRHDRVVLERVEITTVYRPIHSFRPTKVLHESDISRPS